MEALILHLNQFYMAFLQKYDSAFMSLTTAAKQHPCDVILHAEGEFLVKKVMSLEGVWYELSVTLQSTSYQTPSKLITFLTKNSPSEANY